MNNFISKFKSISASALISAGFIGPGVITACAVSGAAFGYSLLWAVIFSAISAIILQEMAVRLGASTKKDFGENIREQIKPQILKILAVFIALSCIVVGNIVFEIGNFAGSTMALNAIFPKVNVKFWAVLATILILILVFTGGYRKIKNLFSIGILLMGFAFLVTALVIRPNILDVLRGMFYLKMPNTDQAWTCVVSIVGTTVVPYNIFLYAANSSKNEDTRKCMRAARFDTIASVALGGVISAAIMICAVTAFHGNKTVITNGTQLAMELSPTFGNFSNVLFSLGFFCASFAAAIVVPVVTTRSIAGILGRSIGERALSPNAGKIICILTLVLSAGACAILYHNPVTMILFAQIVNAIILPVVVAFLILAANSKKLGGYRNTVIDNILSIIVFLITVLISYRAVLLVIHKLESMSIL